MQVSVYKNRVFVFTKECSNFVPSEKNRMVCNMYYRENSTTGCGPDCKGFVCKRENVRKQTEF